MEIDYKKEIKELEEQIDIEMNYFQTKIHKIIAKDEIYHKYLKTRLQFIEWTNKNMIYPFLSLLNMYINVKSSIVN